MVILYLHNGYDVKRVLLFFALLIAFLFLLFIINDMALLDPNFKNETPVQFWLDELENAKRLLHEIEKAILYFTQEALSSSGVQEYTIDTGQDRQTVKRSDLSSLYIRHKELLNIISILETRARPTGGAVRVQPW